MNKLKKTAHLTIFLVKEGVVELRQILKADSYDSAIEIPISGYGSGQLYLKKTLGHPPNWASLFFSAIDIQQIGTVSNISGVFLLFVANRYYIISLGQGGRFLIQDDICEERFGLLVALNSVDKKSFRCIDKQSLDAIQSHTRIQSGQETAADQFGINVEQDMLKAIVGTPVDERLGGRMTGTDALSVSVKMDLTDLPFLLEEYRKKFDADLSAQDYQWVNNISLVKSNSSVIESLEQLVIEKFTNKDFANLWLAIPEIIPWDTVKGFMYKDGNGVIYPDIELKGFLESVKNKTVSLDMLKARHVYCADEDHRATYKNWSVYKCMYAEVDRDGLHYVLNDGKWYQVNKDFVSRTENDFKNIKTSSLQLPPYDGGGEGAYNAAVCATYPNQFFLLDDKNKIFHGGGHGQVEVCDLFSIEKQLVHVKIYGKSSVFSHLFSQGFVSGQLLQIDSDFRLKVKNKLTAPFDDLIAVEPRPADKEFTIIFAVISESSESTLYMPFFSRVNLNNTAKILRGFGYNVELLKIEVAASHSKNKVCPPKRQRH